jgi:hypothetical protein
MTHKKHLAFVTILAGGGAAAPWTPESLGLHNYWVADDLVGATGTAVTSWTDRLANANGTAADAQCPTIQATTYLNGHKSVQFTPSQFLNANAAAEIIAGTDKAWTIFFVALWNSATGTPAVCGFGKAAGSSPFSQIYANASSHWLINSRDDAGTDINIDMGAAEFTSYHSWIISCSGTAVTVWLDGTKIVDAAAHDFAAFTSNTFTIGAMNRGGTIYSKMRGNICEMGLRASALSPAEQALLDSYLDARYFP